RRVTSRRCSLETTMQFRAASYRQLAGVTAYYNTRNWHFAYLTADDDGRPILEVLSCDTGRPTPHPACRTRLDGIDRIGLRVEFDNEVVRFAYNTFDAAGWRQLPAEL